MVINTILPISTKGTITSHQNSLNARDRTYNIGNKGLGMGQAQTFGGVIFAVFTRTINSWMLCFLNNWNFKAHHFRHNFVMNLLSMVGIFLT